MPPLSLPGTPPSPTGSAPPLSRSQRRPSGLRRESHRLIRGLWVARGPVGGQQLFQVLDLGRLAGDDRLRQGRHGWILRAPRDGGSPAGAGLVAGGHQLQVPSSGLCPLSVLEAGELPSIAATFGGAARMDLRGPPWPSSSFIHARTGWVETEGHPHTESHPPVGLACCWRVSAITDWTRKKGVPIHERMVHALSSGALRRAQSALRTAVSAVPPSS